MAHAAQKSRTRDAMVEAPPTRLVPPQHLSAHPRHGASATAAHPAVGRRAQGHAWDTSKAASVEGRVVYSSLELTQVLPAPGYTA